MELRKECLYDVKKRFRHRLSNIYFDIKLNTSKGEIGKFFFLEITKTTLCSGLAVITDIFNFYRFQNDTEI